jgi:hypothetical protein
LSTPERPGIARTILVAVIVVVLVLAGVGIILGSGAMNSSTSASSTSVSLSLTSGFTTNFFSTSSATSTSSTVSIPGLAIDDMDNDVIGPGEGFLNTNMTTIDGTDIYLGNASSTFVVQFQILYVNCDSTCPTHVTSVNVTSGFTIESTTPTFPIPINNPPGAASGEVQFLFTLTVLAPSTPFNGPLTMVATTQ